MLQHKNCTFLRRYHHAWFSFINGRPLDTTPYDPASWSGWREWRQTGCDRGNSFLQLDLGNDALMHNRYAVLGSKGKPRHDYWCHCDRFDQTHSKKTNDFHNPSYALLKTNLIVAIVGPYRSGKSFLSNQILEKNAKRLGFTVSSPYYKY